MIECSTFVFQKLLFVLNLSRFTRFSWGKIWYGRFAPCKRFDISQLWLASNEEKGNRISEENDEEDDGEKEKVEEVE